MSKQSQVSEQSVIVDTRWDQQRNLSLADLRSPSTSRSSRTVQLSGEEKPVPKHEPALSTPAPEQQQRERHAWNYPQPFVHPSPRLVTSGVATLHGEAILGGEGLTLDDYAAWLRAERRMSAAALESVRTGQPNAEVSEILAEELERGSTVAELWDAAWRKRSAEFEEHVGAAG